MDRFWPGMLGFAIFLICAFVGRRFFEHALAKDLWVLASGVIGCVLSLSVVWVVSRMGR